MTTKVLVPVLLDLTGLRVLFVGAGAGTRTKLAAIADQNPAVRVVAPVVSPEVAALVSRLSDAQVYQRPFQETDLDGISLVYGMTDDPGVNARLAQLCRSRSLWANVARNREGGSFTSPALARADGVIAAFSSESGIPALSAAARDTWLESR